MIELKAELKSTNRILTSPWSVQMLQNIMQSHVDCIIHRPVCSVGKLKRSSEGPVMSFRWASTSFSNNFMTSDVRATGL